MKARKMTQRQLAALSGVDHSTISRLVRGERAPTLATANLLRRALAGALPGSASPSAEPTTLVLKALQSDNLLGATDVKTVMDVYLAIRERRKEDHEQSSAAS
jgi:transcriptional regulator with XRE-family HTH domain